MKQTTQLAPVLGPAGEVIEPPGSRTVYYHNGQMHEEVRRYFPDGTVRRTIRNIITGAHLSTETVAAEALGPL